jgi:hypothetical protein
MRFGNISGDTNRIMPDNAGLSVFMADFRTKSQPSTEQIPSNEWHTGTFLVASPPHFSFHLPTAYPSATCFTELLLDAHNLLLALVISTVRRTSYSLSTIIQRGAYFDDVYN